MKITNIDGDHVGLIMSRFELGMMGNSLNEVCNGFEVSDFAHKMGGGEPRVHQILLDIIPVFRKMKHEGLANVSVSFTRFELRAIIGALKEVCNEFEDWEFPIRMGADRREVNQILKFIVPVCREMKRKAAEANKM